MTDWRAWDRAYHDLWCPPQIREADPGGCSAGLAVGYGWIPLVVLLAVAAFIHMIISTRHKEEEPPDELHR